ncbi:MAG: lipopolysaccharide assembly protein LapA domain-containing protein [Pseudoxanthomonas sp.]
MNALRLILVVLCLAIGLILGLVNSQPIALNFLFGHYDTTSGMAIVCALLLGFLAGGLIVLATVAWPLYARLRKAGKAAPVDVSGGLPPVPPAAGT